MMESLMKQTKLEIKSELDEETKQLSEQDILMKLKREW